MNMRTTALAAVLATAAMMLAACDKTSNEGGVTPPANGTSPTMPAPSGGPASGPASAPQ